MDKALRFYSPVIEFYSTFTSKINVTPKGVCLPISKLHSISAVANLLAHNNMSQICYGGQISLLSAAVFLTIWHFWVIIYFAGDDTLLSRRNSPARKTLV